MNIALPEMLQRLNVPQNIIGDGGGMELSVLERKHARMKWQHEQLQQQQQSFSCINGNDQMCMFPLPPQAQQFQGLMNSDQCLGDLLSQAMKQDPDVENGWNAFGNISEEGKYCVGDMSSGSGFDIDYTIPRTISCPPAVAAAMAEAAVATCKGKETPRPEKLSSAVGRDGFKKRKVDKSQNQKLNTEEETKDKKMKGCAQEGDSKITEQHSNNSNGESSADASRENSKVSEVKKPDFIHVRARRGQATDSHSLAERVRREKISERMKFLQDLVPGCNKVVGKAGMLDEIINYVQSLQKQVEFLSMKLAAVNPAIDFNIDSLFTKEMFPGGLSSEMANLAHLQFNPLPQGVSCSGMETSISPPDMALRRTISAPVSMPETFLDQSCFYQIQHSSTWDADLQNLYAMEFEQGKSSSFFSQPFAGYIEAGHVKLEI